MRIRIILILVSITLYLSACTTYDYSKQYVQQGTLLTGEQFQRLRIRMSKEDVAILLGTSLISPVFQNNRWDYAYTWQKHGKMKCIRSVSLFFNNDRLERMQKTDRCEEMGREHYALKRKQEIKQ